MSKLYRPKFRIRADLRPLKMMKIVFPKLIKEELEKEEEVYFIENLDVPVQPEYKDLADGFVSLHTKENFAKLYEPIE